MESIKWLDFLLGTFVLAVVPLFLAAYGGHLAAQALPDPKSCRNAKFIFWGLCLFGIFIAVIYQYRVEKTDEQRELRAAKADAERQQKIDQAQRDALEAESDLKAIERSNGNQIVSLQKRLDKLITGTRDTDQASSVRELKDELSTMAEELRRQIAHSPPTVSLGLPVTPTNTRPTSSQICRSDALNDCSDEALLEWGRPLVAKVEEIETAHMSDLKALDDIKGKWIGFLIGKDKDSKWLKAYAAAQEKAADQFRDCCAEHALNYHKELAQRVSGGLEKKDLYDWIQRLLSPVKSKEWKAARSEGGSRIVDITGDLHIFQINLRQKTSLSKVK